jgi:hypothetical protein
VRYIYIFIYLKIQFEEETTPLIPRIAVRRGKILKGYRLNSKYRTITPYFSFLIFIIIMTRKTTFNLSQKKRQKNPQKRKRRRYKKKETER